MGVSDKKRSVRLFKNRHGEMRAKHVLHVFSRFLRSFRTDFGQNT